MKISTKGQITIPQEFREKLRLFPECEIEFVLDGDLLIIRKVKDKKTRGRSLIERMKNKSEVKMTTDEILKLTRES